MRMIILGLILNVIKVPKLETERLILKSMSLDDIDFLFRGGVIGVVYK